MVLAGRRRDLRPVLAGLDPVDHVQQGRGATSTSHLFTQMTPPPGERRRPAQRLLRQRGDVPAGDRSSARRSASRPAPIWPNTPTTASSATSIRFVNDILLSAPSIVLGLFVYTLVVAQIGHFSALGRRHRAGLHRAAGDRAHHRRDAAAGAQRRCAKRRCRSACRSGRSPCRCCTARALPGIVTGVLLALARISGETAPLLFTALSNQYWSTDLTAPMANVPVVIFQYAMSPYEMLAHPGLGRRLRRHHVRAAAEPRRPRHPAPQQDQP